MDIKPKANLPKKYILWGLVIPLVGFIAVCTNPPVDYILLSIAILLLIVLWVRLHSLSKKVDYTKVESSDLSLWF